MDFKYNYDMNTLPILFILPLKIVNEVVSEPAVIVDYKKHCYYFFLFLFEN